MSPFAHLHGLGGRVGNGLQNMHVIIGYNSNTCSSENVTGNMTFAHAAGFRQCFLGTLTVSFSSLEAKQNVLEAGIKDGMQQRCAKRGSAARYRKCGVFATPIGKLSNIVSSHICMLREAEPEKYRYARYSLPIIPESSRNTEGIWQSSTLTQTN
jgi:hypothetical protein